MAKTNWDKLTPAQAQKKARQLEQNPGTRASVPTKYLSSQFRQQRLLNARLDQPITAGSDMTVREAAQQRNAAVEQKYGDAMRTSQAQVKAIPAWYDQYRQQLQVAQQAAQAGYQAGVQAFQGLQQGTQAQQGQQQVADYSTQAQQLGQIADPALQQRAAQAAAIRGAAVGDLGSVVAAQGANQAAYGANQYAVAGQSQLEALQKELADQKQLQIQKGAYATSVDADIKDTARKQVLENQAFGLDVAKTQASIADQQADNARQDAKDKQQQLSQAEKAAGPGGIYTAAEWRKMSTAEKQKAWADYKKATSKPGGGGGSGSSGPDGTKPATPAQRNDANTQIQRALNWARQYKQQNRPRSDAGRVLVNGSNAAATVDERKYQELLKKGVKPVDARRQATVKSPSIPKFDQLYASVALDVAYDGHVSRANAQKLHSMGLTVKDLGLPSYASTVTPNRPTSAGGRPHG